MQKVAYIAQDRPDYEVLKDVEAQHERTDEAYGMAMGHTWARHATYENACDVVAEKLREFSTYEGIVRSNESLMYQGAALIFDSAKRAQHPRNLSVQLGGRVYSVTEMP